MSLASAPLPTDPDALRLFAAGLQTELARQDIEIAANAAEIHAKTLHIEKLRAQLPCCGVRGSAGRPRSSTATSSSSNC